MSNEMLFGVLRMPVELAMSDELSRLQFYERVQQAANMLATLQIENDNLRALLATPGTNSDEQRTAIFIRPDPMEVLRDDCGQLLAENHRLADELRALRSAPAQPMRLARSGDPGMQGEVSDRRAWEIAIDLFGTQALDSRGPEYVAIETEAAAGEFARALLVEVAKQRAAILNTAR